LHSGVQYEAPRPGAVAGTRHACRQVPNRRLDRL